MKQRGDWGESKARSCELRATKPPCYAGFFMLNLRGRFLQTIFFSCIQISSFLESQFNINRHFAISRVGARDSGNNAEI